MLFASKLINIEKAYSMSEHLMIPKNINNELYVVRQMLTRVGKMNNSNRKKIHCRRCLTLSRNTNYSRCEKFTIFEICLCKSCFFQKHLKDEVARYRYKMYNLWLEVDRLKSQNLELEKRNQVGSIANYSRKCHYCDTATVKTLEAPLLLPWII